MATEPRLQSWFRAAQQQSESIEIETPAHGDRHEQAHPRSPCASGLALAFGSPAQAQEPTNPVGFTLSCNIPAGQLTCSGQVSLLAGKRVVLENVSARVHAPSGQTVQLYVSTSSGNLPSGSMRRGITWCWRRRTAAPSISLTSSSACTALSARPFQGQRISYSQGAPGSVDYEVWFTGYLLP
jgi:hypothetical protein